MGGTTAKCALVEDGALRRAVASTTSAATSTASRSAPVLDIVEVGAGGGSIAWLDAQQRLHVGPRSAGSAPGPGRLRPRRHRADRDRRQSRARPHRRRRLPRRRNCKLDAAAARHPARSPSRWAIAAPERRDIAAHGILDLATVTMAGAIKEITIERGLDARDFVLFVFGGGGPAVRLDRWRASCTSRGRGPAAARQLLHARHAARRCARRPGAHVIRDSRRTPCSDMTPPSRAGDAGRRTLTAELGSETRLRARWIDALPRPEPHRARALRRRLHASSILPPSRTPTAAATATQTCAGSCVGVRLGAARPVPPPT